MVYAKWKTVYTGIFDVTKNTNGLAAVMGHEIARAVVILLKERVEVLVLMLVLNYWMFLQVVNYLKLIMLLE